MCRCQRVSHQTRIAIGLLLDLPLRQNQKQIIEEERRGRNEGTKRGDTSNAIVHSTRCQCDAAKRDCVSIVSSAKEADRLSVKTLSLSSSPSHSLPLSFSTYLSKVMLKAIDTRLFSKPGGVRVQGETKVRRTLSATARTVALEYWLYG